MDWFSKRNQETMFGHLEYRPMSRVQIPSIVGDYFETITRHLIYSRSVSEGWMAEKRTDLICKTGLVEVKSGYHTGKVVFTDSQWKYYEDYFDLHNNGKVKYNIFYFFYSYVKGDKAFYKFSNPDSIYKHLCKVKKTLYVFDHTNLAQGIKNGCFKIQKFNWPRNKADYDGTPGFLIYFNSMGQFLEKNKDKCKSFRVKNFKIFEIPVSGFDVTMFIESSNVNFRTRPGISTDDEDIGNKIPEYGGLPF